MRDAAQGGAGVCAAAGVVRARRRVRGRRMGLSWHQDRVGGNRITARTYISLVGQHHAV